MQNLKKRVLSIILALCTIAGLLPGAPAMTASAAEELVNVALLGSASTTDGSYADHVIGNVIDGDARFDRHIKPSDVEVMCKKKGKTCAQLRNDILTEGHFSVNIKGDQKQTGIRQKRLFFNLFYVKRFQNK